MLIWEGYLWAMGLRLSFMVGVSSSPSGVHSSSRIWEGLDLLDPGQLRVGLRHGRPDGGEQTIVVAEGRHRGAARPCCAAQVVQPSGSSTMSATLKGRRSPMATAWPISGDALVIYHVGGLASHPCRLLP